MGINRRFLYVGLFLFAIGGVIVAADLVAVDNAVLLDVLRLWPLAVIAIGAGLVLRRGRAGLAAGTLAAALAGLVLGSAVAVVPRFAGDCGARGEPASVASTQGTFDGAASVSVKAGCGTLIVTTAPGNAWQFAAGNTAGRAPTVSPSAQALSIDLSGHDGWRFFDGSRDTWNLTLPTSDIADLSLVALANHSRVDLPGARIQSLALTANASKMVVDASAASVANLSAVVNVGSLSITLPTQSDLVGSLRIGGGQLLMCAAPELGLRVTTRGLPREITVDGRPGDRTRPDGSDLQHTESVWESPNYASAAHRADLRVSASFGAVEINPIGGCR